jgi:hypothetical protein
LAFGESELKPRNGRYFTDFPGIDSWEWRNSRGGST